MDARTLVLRSPHSPEAIVIPELLPSLGSLNMPIPRSLATAVTKNTDGVFCVASDVGQCGHLSMSVGSDCSGYLLFLNPPPKVTIVMLGTYREEFGRDGAHHRIRILRDWKQYPNHEADLDATERYLFDSAHTLMWMFEVLKRSTGLVAFMSGGGRFRSPLVAFLFRLWMLGTTKEEEALEILKAQHAMRPLSQELEAKMGETAKMALRVVGKMQRQ